RPVDKCRARRRLTRLATAPLELAHALLLVPALDSDPVVEALELARQVGDRLVGMLEFSRKLLGDRLRRADNFGFELSRGVADYAPRAVGAQALAQHVDFLAKLDAHGLRAARDFLGELVARLRGAHAHLVLQRQPERAQLFAKFDPRRAQGFAEAHDF